MDACDDKDGCCIFDGADDDAAIDYECRANSFFEITSTFSLRDEIVSFCLLKALSICNCTFCCSSWKNLS